MATQTTKAAGIAPAQLEAELSKLSRGVRERFPAGVKLPINGTFLDQAAIDQKLQDWIALFQAVAVAKLAYTKAVRARLRVTVEARTFQKALKAALKLYFGPQSAKLDCFGIATDKPIRMTTAQKALAAEKRARTRIANQAAAREAARSQPEVPAGK